MAKKRDWYWFTCDPDWDIEAIKVWPNLKKPTSVIRDYGWGEYSFWTQKNRGEYELFSFCKSEFEQITGLKIPTDRPVKVRIKLEIVEE